MEKGFWTSNASPWNRVQTVSTITTKADFSKNFPLYKVWSLFVGLGSFPSSCNPFPTDCRCKSTTLFYHVKHFFSKFYKKCFNQLNIKKKQNTLFLNFIAKMQRFSIGFCRFCHFWSICKRTKAIKIVYFVELYNWKPIYYKDKRFSLIQIEFGVTIYKIICYAINWKSIL